MGLWAESESAKEGSHKAVSGPWVSSQAGGCPNHYLGLVGVGVAQNLSDSKVSFVDKL